MLFRFVFDCVKAMFEMGSLPSGRLRMGHLFSHGGWAWAHDSDALVLPSTLF